MLVIYIDLGVLGHLGDLRIILKAFPSGLGYKIVYAYSLIYKLNEFILETLKLNVHKYDLLWSNHVKNNRKPFPKPLKHSVKIFYRLEYPTWRNQGSWGSKADYQQYWCRIQEIVIRVFKTLTSTSNINNIIFVILLCRKTFEEEERLKIEEDRFREAQNAASRAISAAKKVQEFTKSHQGTSRNHPDHILYSIGDSDDSEDDFEAFLESVKVRSDAFRSNKTEFIDGIEALTQNNNKIVSAQPKSLAVTLEDLPHERDGIADGMSSDESFSYDQQNLEVANDNPELEWDKFVDGLEGDEVEIRNRTETEENFLKKTAREIENVT